MPTLTGADTEDFGTYIITKLETILARDLAASPWQARFAACGGVGLVHDDVEAVRHMNSKQPFYFLEVADLRISDGNTPGETGWAVEISIEACTNQSTAPYELFLKAAVVSILNNAYEELVGYGIEGSEIKAGQGRSQKPDRMCPHTFSCEVWTELP
jgi:hypothetical protein